MPPRVCRTRVVLSELATATTTITSYFELAYDVHHPPSSPSCEGIDHAHEPRSPYTSCLIANRPLVGSLKPVGRATTLYGPRSHHHPQLLGTPRGLKGAFERTHVLHNPQTVDQDTDRCWTTVKSVPKRFCIRNYEENTTFQRPDFDTVD